MPAEKRLETEICAGLMFATLATQPPIAYDTDDATSADDVEPFIRASNGIAFNVAFGIFRGHHCACPEERFVGTIRPLVEYLVRHGREVANGQAGAVAVFTALACFDAALGRA